MTDRCPVDHTDYRVDRPAFWHYRRLTELGAEAPIARNTTCGGFWMIQRYDDVRSVFQKYETFTTETITPFNPVQTLRLVPQVYDPPEQVRYRQVLNPWFSPAAVKRREPAARRRCAELVLETAALGTCDFVGDFGLRFPTDVFLQTLGLPTTDGALFVPWIETIFSGFFGGDARAMGAAVQAVRDYFAAVVTERRRSPLDPDVDFVSYLIGTRINGEPVSDDDLVTMCMTMSLAGLDTTRAQLGYIWHHLATHPHDRRQLIEHPETIPTAVEEFLRLYTLVLTAGRRVAADTEVAGCPIANRDVVWLGLLSANRDPTRFERPDEYVPERSPNPHVAFGFGAHKCLGAHLARSELIVAIEEWHRVIPDYELATTSDLVERGGQLTLRQLPLTWERLIQ